MGAGTLTISRETETQVPAACQPQPRQPHKIKLISQLQKPTRKISDTWIIDTDKRETRYQLVKVHQTIRRPHNIMLEMRKLKICRAGRGDLFCPRSPAGVSNPLFMDRWQQRTLTWVTAHQGNLYSYWLHKEQLETPCRPKRPGSGEECWERRLPGRKQALPSPGRNARSFALSFWQPFWLSKGPSKS